MTKRCNVNTPGRIQTQMVVTLGCRAVSLILTLLLLLMAGRVHRLLGVTGQNVISRVVGILVNAASARSNMGAEPLSPWLAPG